jgi:hypothetical protein
MLPTGKSRVYLLHPFLIAIYAPLALYATNAGEVAAGVILRPLLIALALAGLLLVLGRLLMRTWERSGLATSLFLLLFFSYGHLYNALKGTSSLQILARHRIVGSLYLLVLVSGLVLLARKVQHPQSLSVIANTVAVLLLAIPSVQSIVYTLTSVDNANLDSQSPLQLPVLNPSDEALPSVYYIVLDAYMRSDALERDLGFDNSEFITALEQLGFYVPACTRTNYDFTMGSLTATLNMDYLDTLRAELDAHSMQNLNEVTLIKRSRVRYALESLGYRTVAFDSGYEWSRIRDADAYLALGKDSLVIQSLQPFETMFIKSTALRLFTDYTILTDQRDFNLPTSQFNNHINLERFILSTLPGLANDPAPKFVFAHILIPHWPYVFLPDGSIRNDPTYSSKVLPPSLRDPAYVDSVQFINKQMSTILKRIIDDSPTPPVIVIMGDHGLSDDNRTQNFAAIYLPKSEGSTLYHTITPVNYFRIVFNTTFNADLPLLPDISYRNIAPKGSPEDYRPFPETSPECLNSSIVHNGLSD